MNENRGYECVSKLVFDSYITGEHFFSIFPFCFCIYFNSN